MIPLAVSVMSSLIDDAIDELKETVEDITEEAIEEFFSNFLRTFLDSINNLLQDELEYVVDLLLGTILTVPRIETEGPLTGGRPTGQPLSEIGDFLTPSLFNSIAAESYDYVWIGAGGSITITAIVMYLVMIMVAGEYEMVQFDTSNKKERNPLVGFGLIVFWFPLYLLVIALSHGFVHAVVGVDQIVETVTSVLLTIISGVSIAVGTSTAIPGGATVGMLIVLTMMLISIISVIPYVFLVMIMVARSFIMGVFLLFGPFLVAGSWSGLPMVSDTCDKILWKSIVIAILPVVMVPILYVADLVFLPLFSGPDAATAGVSVGVGGAMAFAMLGYGLVAAIWIGFSKISPSAKRAGQSLLRSGVAFTIVGAGNKLGIDSHIVSRAAETSVRVGPIRGVGTLGAGYVAEWEWRSESSGEWGENVDDNGDGDRWENVDDNGDGDRWWNVVGKAIPNTELSEHRADLDAWYNDLILNPEVHDGEHWTWAPEMSEFKLDEILEELNEADMESDGFISESEFFEKLNEIQAFKGDFPEGSGEDVRYAIADAYNKQYGEDVIIPKGIAYEVVDENNQADTQTTRQPIHDPLMGNGRVIYDPVEAAFDPYEITEEIQETWSESISESISHRTEDPSYDSDQVDKASEEVIKEETEDGVDKEGRDIPHSTSKHRSEDTVAHDLDESDNVEVLDSDSNRTSDNVEVLDSDSNRTSDNVEVLDSDSNRTFDDSDQDTARHRQTKPELEVESKIETEESDLDTAVDEKETDSEDDVESPERKKDSVHNLTEKRADEYHRLQNTIIEYQNKNKEITTAGVLGNADAEPSVWFEALSEALDTNNPSGEIEIPSEIRSD